jgi:hypothetical protein
VLLADIPAAGANVNVKAFDALFIASVPVVVLATPRVGVAVQDDAVPDVAFGTVPAAALVAFVPPLAIAVTPRDVPVSSATRATVIVVPAQALAHPTRTVAVELRMLELDLMPPESEA